MKRRSAVKPHNMVANPAFPPGMRAGDYLFISGQVAQDSDDNIVGHNDCEAQARQVMERIRAITADAGASLRDVIKITTFLTDISNYPAFNKVRGETFPEDPPASSTVIVAGLVRPELMVEVEAVVYLPGSAT